MGKLQALQKCCVYAQPFPSRLRPCHPECCAYKSTHAHCRTGEGACTDGSIHRLPPSPAGGTAALRCCVALEYVEENRHARPLRYCRLATCCSTLPIRRCPCWNADPHLLWVLGSPVPPLPCPIPTPAFPSRLRPCHPFVVSRRSMPVPCRLAASLCTAIVTHTHCPALVQLSPSTMALQHQQRARSRWCRQLCGPIPDYLCALPPPPCAQHSIQIMRGAVWTTSCTKLSNQVTEYEFDRLPHNPTPPALFQPTPRAFIPEIPGALSLLPGARGLACSPGWWVLGFPTPPPPSPPLYFGSSAWTGRPAWR
jgi:hypothetical protein